MYRGSVKKKKVFVHMILRNRGVKSTPNQQIATKPHLRLSSCRRSCKGHMRLTLQRGLYSFCLMWFCQSVTHCGFVVFDGSTTEGEGLGRYENLRGASAAAGLR